MADHVLLGEVLTYYERAGKGDPLVLLHPGGVDSRVFASLIGRRRTCRGGRAQRRRDRRAADGSGAPRPGDGAGVRVRGLPDAQLAVVPAAGHGLPLDRPELFTLLVTEFVTTAGR